MNNKAKIIIGILVLAIFFVKEAISWIDDSPLATGSHIAVVSADFNWDNLIDLAVAPSEGGILIWYRTPIGWEPMPEVVTLTGTYRSLAAGDINYDGTIDLVAAGSTVGAWLHKYTSSGFIWSSANNFYPTPTGIYNSIALANVNIVEEKYGCVSFHNCDGLQEPFPYGLDIIVSSNTGEGQGIKVYRWSGYILNGGECQGSWEIENTAGLPNNGYYNQVITSNFNLDASPDIAAAKNGGIDVWFRTLIYDPTGCFMPDLNANYSPIWELQNGFSSDVLPSNGDYLSIAAVDINSDNYPDIAAAGNPTERPDGEAGIEVWYGIADELIWSWYKEINAFNHFDHLVLPGQFKYLVLKDFNNDNIIDIAAGLQYEGIRVWRGQYYIDNPTLPCPPTINPAIKECPEPATFYWLEDISPITSGTFKSLAANDFNKDGKNDLAGADSNATPTSIGIKAFLSDYPNTFNYSSWYHVNIDSFPEFKQILAGMKFSGTNVYSGQRQNQESTILLGPDTNATSSMIVATVEDINPPNENSEIKIYKTDGEGFWHKLSDIGCTPLAEGEYEDAQLVNLNNDDLFDVIAGKKGNSSTYNGIRAWIQSSYCDFIEISNGLSTQFDYNEVAIADINNDGFKDIVAAKNGGIELWCGNPELINIWNWVPCGSLADGKNIVSIVANDFNEDGFIDIVSCSDNLLPIGGLTYYYQTNNGSQWSSELIGSPFICTRVFATKYKTCIADENDEHYDIIASSQSSGIFIFRHAIIDNLFQWISMLSPITNDDFSRAIAADTNLDGHSDIVAWQAYPGNLINYYWDCSEWHPTIIDSDYLCVDMDTEDFNNDLLPDLVSACQSSTTGDHVLRVSYSYSLPTTPNLISPPNNSNVNTREPTFQFSTSSSYTNCLRFFLKLENGIQTSDHNGAFYPNGWSANCYGSSQTASYAFQVNDTFPEGLPNGIYYWKVKAYDGFRYSDTSTSFTFTVNPEDQTPPTAVQNLLVEKITGGVNLIWNKVPDTDVNRYRIFRGETPTFSLIPSNMIGQVASTVNDPIVFADKTSLSPPIAFYKVKAVDSTGNVGP